MPTQASPHGRLLHALVGDRPAEGAVLYAATIAPPKRPGQGLWRQRPLGSLEEAARFLTGNAERSEVYAATAWFAPGQRRVADAVIAKCSISTDVDDKLMPGATPEERHRQARVLVDALPCPFVLIDTGGGYQPHLILPPEHRVEHFADPEDGRRRVEILMIGLRLFLEARAPERIGAHLELDHADGVERPWRMAPGWNQKLKDGVRDRTPDSRSWRPTQLVAPRLEGLGSVQPADLSFLRPYLPRAEEVWESRGCRRGAVAATLAPTEPNKLASKTASVAVASEARAHFEVAMLPDGLSRRWPMKVGDQSEHDFAVCSVLAEAGWSPATARLAIQLRRSLLDDPADRAKGERGDYVQRTVANAYRESAPRFTGREGPAPYLTFPLASLPSCIAEFVRTAAAALVCSPEAVLLPHLAMLGACIGNSCRIQLKGTWTEPALLWALVVMLSGKLKSPAQEIALQVLTRRQRDAIRAWQMEMKTHAARVLRHELELTAWKKKKDFTSDPPPAPEEPSLARTIVQDTTLEALAPLLEANPRGLLMSRDELGAWIKSFDAYRQGRGGDLHQWLSIHRAGDTLIDRKGKLGPVYVEYAFVAICGGIQPPTLRRILTREMVEAGLLARFLVVMPDPPRRHWTDADVPPAVLNRVEHVVSRLCTLEQELLSDGSGRPRLLGLSREAKELWIRHYNEAAVRQEAVEDDPALNAAFSKLEAYSARLALIFELVSWADGSVAEPPSSVSAESLRRAIEAAEWFCRETERVYAALWTAPEESRLQELHAWIKARGGRTCVRDLARGPRRFRGTMRRAEEALRDLVMSGQAWWKTRAIPASGGRTVRECVLRTPDDVGGDGDTRSDEPPFVAGLEERVSPGGVPNHPSARERAQAVADAVGGTVISMSTSRTPQTTTAQSPCRACRGSDYWKSVQGEKVCRTCHPPAPGAEVAA